MILYTDGLSEVQNYNEEQFDAEWLRKIILQHGEKPCYELVNDLIDEARKFSKEDHRWDDITIVCIEKIKSG